VEGKLKLWYNTRYRMEWSCKNYRGRSSNYETKSWCWGLYFYTESRHSF